MQAGTLEASSMSIQRRHSTGLRRYAWLLLAYNVFVILWGAVVRATSSGDGCGAHWPLCNGTILQHHPKAATIIEFLHRMSSGVALIGVLLLVLFTYRRIARGTWARIAVVAAALLTLNEAFLGALLVLLRHVAQDQSAARSVYLALHLTNTLLMLAALALSAYLLSADTPIMRAETRLAYLPTAIMGLGATVVVGVTGSLAALGDTLFPAQTLTAALQQDLAPHTNWLIRVRILHPLSAVVAAFFIAWLVFRSITIASGTVDRRLSLAVVLLLGFQIVLGIADVSLLAPVWMQVLHLLGADILWAAMVILCAQLCLHQRTRLASS